MKILLIPSYTLDSVTRVGRTPPLSLLCLAAVLRQAGHDPQILDLDALPIPRDRDREAFYIQTVLEAVADMRPGMVGMNCLLTTHFPFVRRMATAIKAQHPFLPIAIGGIHPTLFAREILEHCPAIDAIALGEGEDQVVALAQAFAHGIGASLRDIEALAFRDRDGTVTVNPRRGYITDLDRLPAPAWDLIRLEDYYTDHSTWYNPRGLEIKMSVPILSSRSCPYNCSFCSVSKMMGRGQRLRSPELVVDEMQMLYERHGINYFGFVDDNLTLNKAHILAICREIIRRGMVIQFESISGYNLNSLDEEIMEAMAEAGCVYVILPIEHGSDRMRQEIIGKKVSREKIFQVVQLCKRFDLLTRGIFIMGFPEETRETLTDTYNMIHDLQLDMNLVLNLIPYPGTRIFQQAVRDHLFLSEIDATRLWDGTRDLNAMQSQFYLRPYNLSLEELQEFREKFDALKFFSPRAQALQAPGRMDMYSRLEPCRALIRPCPRCGGRRGRELALLRFQDFDDSPLAGAFALVACEDCGASFYDTPSKQSDYDRYYRGNAYYFTSAGSGSGGATIADQRRFEALARRLAPHLPGKDATVFDVGCAKGGLLAVLAARGFTRLYGVDMLPSCVDYVNRVQGMAAGLGSALDLPFPEVRADALIYSHIVEHVIDLPGLMAAAREKLSDRGLLYVEVPDAARYGEGARYPYQDLYLEHVNHFDRDGLISRFQAEGFSLVESGEHLIEPLPRGPVPCIWAIFRKGGRPKKMEGRSNLEERLRDYLAWSRQHPLMTKLSQLAREQTPLYVWGISQFAMLILGQTDLGRCAIKALVDRDPYKQQRTVGGRPILPPEVIREAGGETAVIVTAPGYEDQITASLREMGFPGRIITLGEASYQEICTTPD